MLQLWGHQHVPSATVVSPGSLWGHGTCCPQRGLCGHKSGSVAPAVPGDVLKLEEFVANPDLLVWRRMQSSGGCVPCWGHCMWQCLHPCEDL